MISSLNIVIQVIIYVCDSEENESYLLARFRFALFSNKRICELNFCLHFYNSDFYSSI